MTDEEVLAKQMTELVKSYSEAFDTLVMERHQAGAKEYGVFTFLENDVVRMMAEELADTANYCRMQFIKLMILNDFILDKVATQDGPPVDDEGNITIGVKAFKGAGGTGWKR